MKARSTESVVSTSISTGRESDELWCGIIMQLARFEATYCTKQWVCNTII